MLPKAGRSCRRIVSSLRLLYPLAAVTGFPNNPCRGRICPARRLPLPSFSVSGILHKQKALLKSEQGLKRSRHLPIFTGRFQPTIFGTSELNFCVRNGKVEPHRHRHRPTRDLRHASLFVEDVPSKLNIEPLLQIEYLIKMGSSPRPISTR